MKAQGKVKGISVVGLGKLGVPIAACYAKKGFSVVGLDMDAKRVEAISKGQAPIYEPGLQELIREVGSKLRATRDYEEAVMNSEVTFIIVPTPSEKGGGFSLRYVLDAAGRIGDVLRKKSSYHLVVLTSTVMPGATEGKVQPLLEARSGRKCGREVGLCYSPEFVALGSVIRDFLNPDFLLMGESDPHAGDMLCAVYDKVCENKPAFARMNFVNAEVAKLALNTFVTTKITFANMLARICECIPKADVDVVTSALGLDSRIGSKYLKGAIGYGGPCFPRDNLALAALARSKSVQAALAEVTDTFNRQQVPWLKEMVKSRIQSGRRVGVLGLAYKPHSDVVEESQGLLLVQALIKDKIEVTVYDPAAMENARKVISNKSVVFANSAEECIRQSEVVVVTTPWDQFKHLPPASFVRHNSSLVIIDCWRSLEKLSRLPGVTYIPLGMGPVPSQRSA